jgi:hypothetical protein
LLICYQSLSHRTVFYSKGFVSLIQINLELIRKRTYRNDVRAQWHFRVTMIRFITTQLRRMSSGEISPLWFNSNIIIYEYKIYTRSLTQLSIRQLFKWIFNHISHLHVSAGTFYIFKKVQPEDGSRWTSRNMQLRDIVENTF